MAIIGDVIIDGVRQEAETAAISVFDIALLRGYGCFEALRSYSGAAFRTAGHLDRLERSAAALHLPLPDRDDLAEWVRTKAAELGDGRVNVIVTGGLSADEPGTGSHVVVYGEPLHPTPAEYRLLPVVAPWHSAGVHYQLTGVKSTSYAPNMSAMLEARRAGFHDALLLGRDREVLEGPTYSIGWVRGGEALTPSLDLGILASITRQVTIEAAGAVDLPMREVRATLEELLTADEVFVMSTIREIAPVVAVGDAGFEPGPVAGALAAAFRAIVAAETS